MSRFPVRPYLPLAIFLAFLLSLPIGVADTFRSALVFSTPADPSRGEPGLTAQVVHRPSGPWGHTVWIDVGKRVNQARGAQLVAEGSPILVGNTVFGVVEKVEEKRSLVRLVTDPRFTPSVRAVRGSEGDLLLLERVLSLKEILDFHPEKRGAKEIAAALSSFAAQIDPTGETLFLAKGELAGALPSSFRTFTTRLRGIGFNSDFPDERGPARDLRTGRSVEGADRTPLIKVGDLLVTSGFDGVFPPDLHIGIVSKIFPLREGGSSYEVEAHSLLPLLSEIRTVRVLPPT